MRITNLYSRAYSELVNIPFHPVCVILSENIFKRSFGKGKSFQNVIWMTESQEFFRVVCGTGVGVDSATYLKRYIVMLLKIE